MHILLRITLAILLAMAAILYIPIINGFSHQKVAHNIADSPTYPLIHQTIQNNILDNPNLSQNNQLQQAFNQAITPKYIQTKAESTLADASQWITGQTQQPPVVDLNDLRQLLSQHYPETERLDQALQDLGHSSEQIESLPQVTADPALQASLNTLLNQQETLAALADGQAEVHLQPVLTPVKITYQGYTVMLFLLPILFVLLLILPLLFQKTTTRSKLHQLGLHLIWVAGLAGLMLIPFHLALTSLIIPAIEQTVSSQQPIAAHIFEATWQPLSHQALSIIVAITLGGLAIGTALFLSTKPKPSNDLPIASNTPSDNIADKK